MDEIRCPFCNAALNERWLRKQGASLLGKTSGQCKRRSNARQAALKRWAKARAKQCK